MRILVVSALVAVLGATTGCVEFSFKEATAGRVGCPYDEIQIDDKVATETIITWTAECRGVRYYCAWWNKDAVCHASEDAGARGHSEYGPAPVVQQRSPKPHHSPFKARIAEPPPAAPKPVDASAPAATTVEAPATLPTPGAEPAATQ